MTVQDYPQATPKGNILRLIATFLAGWIVGITPLIYTTATNRWTLQTTDKIAIKMDTRTGQAWVVLPSLSLVDASPGRIEFEDGGTMLRANLTV